MTPPQRDRFLIVLVISLVVLGLVMVQSASGPVAGERSGNPFYYVERQFVGVVVGAIGCIALAWIPMSWFRKHVWWIYGIAVGSLVLVFVPGISHEANGASRWIGVGGFHLQPSEFAKIALALCMAHYLDENRGNLEHWKGPLGKALAIPLPLVLLVLLEPDFGTAAILCGLSVLLLFVGGLSARYLVGILTTTLVVGLPVMLLASYRLRRVQSFLDPWADEAGAGYQVIQSLIAFSSGGLMGRGLGESQAKHLFLPEPWTDFIASVLAEELGLLGLLALIGLYALVVLRGLAIARGATSLFDTLLASSLTILIGAQAFFNLGVALGVLPPKGLVLPFLSYGPSALMAHLCSIGLILNVSARSGRAPGGARFVRAGAMSGRLESAGAGT